MRGRGSGSGSGSGSVSSSVVEEPDQSMQLTAPRGARAPAKTQGVIEYEAIRTNCTYITALLPPFFFFFCNTCLE